MKADFQIAISGAAVVERGGKNTDGQICASSDLQGDQMALGEGPNHVWNLEEIVGLLP